LVGYKAEKGAAPSAWLRVQIKFAVLNSLTAIIKKQEREKGIKFISFEKPITDDGATVYDVVADETPNAEDDLLFEEEKQRVSKFLDSQFSQKNKVDRGKINKVMKLRFVENLRNGEIAERLGETEHNIHSLVSHGVATLKRNMTARGIKRPDRKIFGQD
jgi:DNA-directed RNA polymerase specialized sigma24 family protein